MGSNDDAMHAGRQECDDFGVWPGNSLPIGNVRRKIAG
jgi:hypothetical protein